MPHSRRLVLALLVGLLILHHDFWYWDDPTLIGGVMPVGLAWHVAYSVVASLVWVLVVLYAWPADPWAEEST